MNDTPSSAAVGDHLCGGFIHSASTPLIIRTFRSFLIADKNETHSCTPLCSVHLTDQATRNDTRRHLWRFALEDILSSLARASEEVVRSAAPHLSSVTLKSNSIDGLVTNSDFRDFNYILCPLRRLIDLHFGLSRREKIDDGRTPSMMEKNFSFSKWTGSP